MWPQEEAGDAPHEVSLPGLSSAVSESGRRITVESRAERPKATVDPDRAQPRPRSRLLASMSSSAKPWNLAILSTRNSLRSLTTRTALTSFKPRYTPDWSPIDSHIILCITVVCVEEFTRISVRKQSHRLDGKVRAFLTSLGAAVGMILRFWNSLW